MKTILLLLASLSLLTGCLPTSSHPLGSAEKAAPDERIAGVWYGKNGEDQIFLHFVPGKGAEMQVVEVDHEKKGAAHTTLYHAFPTTIEGNHYLNVREGDKADYYFVRYQLSTAGTLTLTVMSDAVVSKAISSHKVAGKISGSEDNRDVKLTDSTEKLAAFVAKADPDLQFNQKFGAFKRVSLPSLDSGEESTVKKSGTTKSSSKSSSKSSHKPSSKKK